MILIWLAALVVLLDQLTKNIVVAVMAEGFPSFLTFSI